MYKIYLNDTVICNSEVNSSILISPTVEMEANKAGTFTFTIYPSHPYYDSEFKKTDVITVEKDGDILMKCIPTVETVDFFKNRTITCEGELTYLNDSILRQHKYENMNVLSLLTAYINEHNSQVEDYKKFTVGQVTVTSSESVLRYTNMQSTMTELNEDFIDNFGGYFRIRYDGDTKYIDYLAESPRFCNQTIELGKNLLDYSSNIDTTDIATVVIPLGAPLPEVEIEGLDKKLDIKSVNDGKDYLEASDDVIATLGRTAKVVEWDDVTVASNLKAKGEKYLQDEQFSTVVIECSAVDLGVFDNDVNSFKLLDTVNIKSEAHGMNRNFVLTKVAMNLNEPENDVFTFGKTEKSSMVSITNKIVKSVEKKMPSTSNILKLAQDNASAIIAGAEGGYVVIDTDEYNQPYRILVMDNKDKAVAQNVIQLNKNGIGFSKTGIDGPYSNAWTIDGNLVADFITSGVLNGVTVQATEGYVGDWKIASGTDNGSLYADSTDGTYRVWMHTPKADGEGNTWVFSLKKKYPDGVWRGLFYVNKEGNIYSWGGIDTHGNISTDGNISCNYGSISAKAMNVDGWNVRDKIMYKKGDEISLDGKIFGGYLSTSKTEVYFHIPLPMWIGIDISSVTISGTFKIRCAGVYVVGSASAAATLQSKGTVTTTFDGDKYGIRVKLVLKSASTANNNYPLSIDSFSDAKITFN